MQKIRKGDTVVVTTGRDTLPKPIMLPASHSSCGTAASW